MNKNLILLTNDYWVKEYYLESILPNKINNVFVISDKKNLLLTNYIKKVDQNHKFFYLKNLTLNWLKKNIDIKNSFLISAGSPWIINEKIINHFKNKIFNIHQSALPSMRGSVNSYVRLYNLKSIQTTIHVVTKKIDEGNIVFNRDVFIERNLNLPKDINNFLQKQNRLMLKDFLKIHFHGKKKIEENKQNNFFSSYNPRLKSEINGWIDWSLNVYELDRFINAFEDPYPGARTMIHGKKVIFRDVDYSCEDSSRHPYENGMILRKFMDKLVISVNGGSLYIGKILLGKKNITNDLKAGEIFYTPLSKLNISKRKNLYIQNNNIYTTKKKIKKI